MFWMTRPTIRATWTVLVGCIVGWISVSTHGERAWMLSLGGGFVVWGGGWLFVRPLTVFFAFVLDPIYRLLIRIVRLWVAFVCFLFVSVAGACRASPPLDPNASSTSWSAFAAGAIESGGADLIREGSLRDEWKAAVVGARNTSLLVGIFMSPFLCLLRWLPQPLLDYRPPPPGNYTLD
jgi:hypothetical protein